MTTLSCPISTGPWVERVSERVRGWGVERVGERVVERVGDRGG